MSGPLAHLSPNHRGMIAMSAASLAFITNDSLVKLVSASLPTGEIMALRGLIGCTLLIGVVLLSGQWRDWRRVLDRRAFLRTLGEVGGTAVYLPALFHMPIATSTVILQSAPLLITAAAALFLKEQVGWRRWLAILVGFIGVVIVARPGAEGLSLWALLALSAIGFIAFRDLVTRTIPHAVPGILLTILASIAVALLGLAFGFGLGEEWLLPDPRSFALLSAASLCLASGYLTIIFAMRVGEIAVIAPFRYTIIPFAILLGLIFWGDIPDGATLLGTIIIIAAGVYTFWRERKSRHSLQAELTTPVPS